MKTNPTVPIYHQAVGRRKSAVATARITKGKGHFFLNGQKVESRESWLKPLQMVGKHDDFDISIMVRGGGMTSQNDAIILAIARALVTNEADVKPTLRKAGLITVDARVKERKKPGLKRARKAPQWAKR